MAVAAAAAMAPVPPPASARWRLLIAVNSIEELRVLPPPARSFYYQSDGRIYDVPEGIELPDDPPPPAPKEAEGQEKTSSAG